MSQNYTWKKTGQKIICVESGFQLKVVLVRFGFTLQLFEILSWWLVKQNKGHCLSQSKVRPKPIVTCSHAFSRAWRRLHVFASSSDWFTALFASCDWSEWLLWFRSYDTPLKAPQLRPDNDTRTTETCLVRKTIVSVFSSFRIRELIHLEPLQNLQRLYLGMNRIQVSCHHFSPQCHLD